MILFPTPLSFPSVTYGRDFSEFVLGDFGDFSVILMKESDD